MLKGRGGEVKGLLSVMKKVMLVHGKMANFEASYKALENLVQVKEILHDHSQANILPLEVARSFHTSVINFLRLYQNLAYEAGKTKRAASLEYAHQVPLALPSLRESEVSKPPQGVHLDR